MADFRFKTLGSSKRILFLDDDDRRAEAFLKSHPEAVWIQTVEKCLESLAEPWDEVHLDHDLGGETRVDIDREDCGMAVVRWLCQEPREHLRSTQFFVHSHNYHAASVMVMHLQVMKYVVEERPFGRVEDTNNRSGSTSGIANEGRLFQWLKNLWTGESGG